QGDYDIDGDVDQDDYTVWRDNYGSNLLLAADGNGNGIIDAGDYTIWRDAFAAASLTASAEAPSAVQEPAVASATATVANDPVTTSGPGGLALSDVFAALAESAADAPQAKHVAFDSRELMLSHDADSLLLLRRWTHDAHGATRATDAALETFSENPQDSELVLSVTRPGARLGGASWKAL
ncbi:MAG: hypothetical protein KDA37_00020, partial [Planctomycetales bacterium]|nr:hypothetical protein [Planctomycetales bacterium]